MPLPELVSLDIAKTFMRVDHDEEDALIAGFIRTATEAALSFADGLGAVTAASVPERVRTAILVHVATLYDRRAEPDVPTAVFALLQPFRTYGAEL